MRSSVTRLQSKYVDTPTQVTVAMNYEDLGIFGLLPENDDRDLYLILHGGIGWWCANGCGYTTSTDDAGVYTREVAEAQARCRYGVGARSQPTAIADESGGTQTARGGCGLEWQRHRVSLSAYTAWIHDYVAQHNHYVRGKCAAATREMVAAFPDLVRVPGLATGARTALVVCLRGRQRQQPHHRPDSQSVHVLRSPLRGLGPG